MFSFAYHRCSSRLYAVRPEPSSTNHRGQYNSYQSNDTRTKFNDPHEKANFSGWNNPKPTIKPFEAGDRLPANEIPDGDFQFILSHVENPMDFYVQLISNEHDISTLTSKLNTMSIETVDFHGKSIETHQICLAKHTDQFWYRAIVLSSNSTTIQVRFVDFGNVLDVDKKSLRQIGKDYCVSAPFAYRCTLKDVECKTYSS
jgi:hypothetical protein